MVHSLEVIEDAVLVQLDLKNGFGTLDRPAAIQALERDGGRGVAPTS
jgi:hypothetical protein